VFSYKTYDSSAMNTNKVCFVLPGSVVGWRYFMMASAVCHIVMCI